MKHILLFVVAFLCLTKTEAQFFEDFNSGIPDNWMVLDIDGGDEWQSTQQGWGGGNGLILFTDSNTDEDYLITPQFTVTAGVSERVAFHVLSVNSLQNFDIRLSTSGTLINDFSVILASETDPQAEFSNYTQYEYDLSAYAGQSIYLAIVSTGPGTGWLRFDEFSNDSFDCPSPYALSGSSTSLTESILTWRNVSGQSDWTVEYGEAGFELGNGTVITEDSTTGVGFVEVADLMAGTAYDYYVQSNCGSQESQWIGPYTITQPLLGESVAFPIPIDLSSQNCSATPTITFDYNASFPFYAIPNNTNVYLNFSCDPQATVQKTGVWTRFISPANGAIKITTTDPNDNFVIHSLNCNSQGICFRNEEVFCYRNPTNMLPQSVINLEPNTAYSLAIWRSGFQPDPEVSEVCIEPLNCVFPLDLDVNITSVTEAEISWNPYDSSQMAWEYVVQEEGMGQPTGSGISTIETSITVAGTENVTYEFYVRTDCGGGVFSDWAGPFEWLQSTIPQNNDCQNAEVLTELTSEACTFFASGNTLGASYAPDNFEDCSFHDEDVWFTFVATSTYYEFEIIPTNSDFRDTDYTAILYDDISDCSTEDDIDNIYCAYNDEDENAIFYELIVGNTYYLRVSMSRFSSEQGLDASFNLCISIPPPPPTNNNCIDAIPVEIGMSYSGDSTWATNFDAIPVCGISTNDDDKVVWYSYTGSGVEEEIRLLFCNRPFSERVGVFTGDCNDLTCLYSFGQVEFEPQSGCTAGFNFVRPFVSDGTSTYYIAIRGNDEDDFGAYFMDIEGTTLSVQEDDFSDAVEVMPNPASNILTIKAKQSYGVINYKIYDQLGQMVKADSFDTPETVLDISGFSQGIYFIRLDHGKKTTIKKLIIN